MLRNKWPLPLAPGEICLGRQPDMLVLGVGVTEKAGCVLWVPEKITFLQVCFLPPFSITTFSCYKMTVIHLFV